MNILLTADVASSRPTAALPQPCTLTVVLPFHNEQAGVAALFARLMPVLDGLGLSFEVLCVEDGSRDATFETLRDVALADPRIRVLRFARNFGKEVALTAGLNHARGEAVVLMDSDLQHPPELIADFVRLWREGWQMVYAQRRRRDTDSAARKMASGAFYWLFRLVSEVTIPEGAGDFRLLDRKVVDALNAMPERSRFMKGLMSWVGFRQTGIDYDVEQRFAGRSTFNLWKLFLFAMDGLVSFSNVPLRMWSWFGFGISAISGLYGLFVLMWALLHGRDLPGYTSLFTAVVFLGGLQLVTLGIIGEYLGRVHTEVKRRPLYLLSDTVGLDGETPVDRSGA
ncbi:MAG: glycosyltransferase family 2 protein [Alphaproteobacteria bacterium]|nr:glycosyltransferase family 2 protein [Alphaproteobacteria bacterium]